MRSGDGGRARGHLVAPPAAGHLGGDESGGKATIQYLAARLISAQMPSGGWGYKVPKLTAPDAATLLGALRKMTPPAKPKEGDPPFDLEKARKAAVATLRGGMKKLPVLFDPDPQLPSDAKNKRE